MNAVITFLLYLTEKLMLGYPQSAATLENPEVSNEFSPLQAPFITHTSATPMVTPQGSPHDKTCDIRNTLGFEHAFSLESFEKSIVCASAQFLIMSLKGATLFTQNSVIRGVTKMLREH